MHSTTMDTVAVRLPVMACNSRVLRQKVPTVYKTLGSSSFTSSPAVLQSQTRNNAIAVRRSLVVRAEEMDFDAILAKGAEAWDKTEAKPAVVGYSVALLFGTYFALSLTHAPLLSFLIGVPVEVLGLYSAAFLAYRYTKEGGDWLSDVTTFTGKVTKELPGFKKD